MLEYDRIDISEDINTNKTGNSDKAITITIIAITVYF